MAGLSYSPELHEDELLYSWLGWLAALNCYADPRALMDLLLGQKNAIISVDLPCRLTQLSDSLGYQFPYANVGDAIERGTLYPYHRPFIDQHVHRLAVAKLNGDGRDLKILLGRVANRFRASAPLRYCPICLKSEIEKWGYGIWHRSHNIPSALCCIKHAVLLHFDVNPTEQSHRGLIFLPPSCYTSYSVQRASPNQLRFSTLGVAALHSGMQAIPAKLRAYLYRSQAQELGFAQKDGRISFPLLTQAIYERYENFAGIPFRERLLATEKKPMRWLSDLIGRPERSLHPILHLLLIDVLWGGFRRFEDAVKEAINSHEEQALKIPSPNIGAGTKRGKKVVEDDENISCRQIAAKSGVTTNTVVQQRLSRGIPVRLRPKKISASLRRAILVEISEGMTASEIAKKNSVSSSSIYRIRGAARQEIIQLYDSRKAELRVIKRREWHSSLVIKHNVKEAKSTNPALYMWLYRNDRTWLLAENIKFKKPRHVSPRVNWRDRDQALCAAVKFHLIAILRNPDRTRITKTLLRRPLSESMIRVNREKLPMFSLLESRFEESISQFQKLRIAAAIRSLTLQDLPIVQWRVEKLAGIRRLSDDQMRYLSDRSKS